MAKTEFVTKSACYLQRLQEVNGTLSKPRPRKNALTKNAFTLTEIYKINGIHKKDKRAGGYCNSFWQASMKLDRIRIKNGVPVITRAGKKYIKENVS